MQKKDSKQKYNDLLDHLDLKPAKEEKPIIDTSALNLDDLLKTSVQSNKIGQHVQNLSFQKTLHTPLQKQEKERIERDIAYKMVKKEISSWQGQIKKDREAQQLDYRDEKKKQLKQVTDETKYTKNSILQKIEDKAKDLKLDSEQNIKEVEKELLGGDLQDVKQKLKLLQKERNLIFQQEIKQKRVSKIKSKIYHRIKNKQKKKLQEDDPQNIEDLERIRAEERMGLRHSTKSKYIKNLLRFGGDDQKNIQNSINEVSNKHKNLVKKIHHLDANSDVSQEYDEENYREQAMNDLENEINTGDSKTGLKFLDDYMAKKNLEAKQAAQQLLDSLKNDEEIQLNDEVKESFQGRQKFKNDKDVEIKEKNSKQSMKKILEEYLYGDQQPKSITEGLNIDSVKQQYKKSQPTAFNKSDWELFQQENEEDLDNFNVMTIQDNEQEFLKDKQAILEEELPKPEKKSMGWGSWAGQGVKNPFEEDPTVALERKKKEIQNLKRKRQDGQMDNVIINESRIKNFSKYLVSDLPHPYTQAQQFDFMQSKTICPEVMTSGNFERNIQAKVLTKKGSIINPIQKKKKL